MTLLSLIDSLVPGVVCFTDLWKRGLCPQAPQISLLELIRSCGLDLDCFGIASLSLTHRAQFLVVKFWLHWLDHLDRWCCRLFLHVGWLRTDWCHGIELQSVWRMSLISREVWLAFLLHWNVVAFWFWTFAVCFLCARFLCCCIWLCRLLLNSCTCCCGHRHRFRQFCNCRADVQNLRMLTQLWVS